MDRRRRPPWQLRQAGLITWEQEADLRQALREQGSLWWWIHFRCPRCRHVRSAINSSVTLPYRLWLWWIAFLVVVMAAWAFLVGLTPCPQCRFERKAGRGRGWLGDD